METVCVSACLLGENCRYDGGNCRSEKVLEWLQGRPYIAVCPERAAGLPCPRDPAEIADGRVRTRSGADADAAFRLGIERTMRAVRESRAALAVLQPRSPCCGVHEIYDGSFTGTLVPGQGLLTRALLAAGIRVLDEREL